MSKENAWIDSKYEEVFEEFNSKITTFRVDLKKLLSDNQVTEFLNFLLSYKALILELPTSTKVSDFTVQRFYLFLMPVIGLLHTLNKDQAES